MEPIVIFAICGVSAAIVAGYKGRSIVGWFIGGFALQIVGVVIVACLPNLKEERAYRESAELERQRLREQLRQERLKNEAYRRYSSQRLDTHDDALGVDTRSQGQLEDEGAPWLLPPETPAIPQNVMPLEPALAGDGAAGDDDKLWYFEEGGQTQGPLPEGQIHRLIREQRINARTLLWAEGLRFWTLAKDIAAFRPEVRT